MFKYIDFIFNFELNMSEKEKLFRKYMKKKQEEKLKRERFR